MEADSGHAGTERRGAAWLHGWRGTFLAPPPSLSPLTGRKTPACLLLSDSDAETRKGGGGIRMECGGVWDGVGEPPSVRGTRTRSSGFI